MKNVIFYLMILIIGITLFHTEIKAQCLNGFTSYNTTIDVNGCQYDVGICVKCPTGPVPGSLYVRDFKQIPETPACTQTWSAQEVLNYIQAQVKNFTYIQNACDQMNAPPCTTSVPITYYEWICWEKELIEYFGEETIVYRPCNYDVWCQETWTYCYDGFGDHTVRTDGPTLFGEITCVEGAEQINDPTELNQPTTCFHIHTECNPE